MTLYELTKEQQYLYDLLANGEAIDMETGEIDPVVEEQLKINNEQIDEKIKAWGIVFKQLLADAKMLKDEEEAISIRRKRADRHAELLKNRLENYMILLGKPQFKDTKVDISFRKAKKVEIVNEKLLPEEYLSVKTTITPAKTLIMNALKEGKEVQGATLVETQNIQIK